MSNDPTRFTRRSVAIGGGIAVALGLAAVGVNAPRWFRAKTPYDDLFALLIDRDAALALGVAIQKVAFRGDLVPGELMPTPLSEELRKRFSKGSLSVVTRGDIASGRMMDVGWVVPESLGLLCLLVALTFQPDGSLGLHPYE